MPNKKYILIADDDKIYTRVFVNQLTEAGYEAFAVANGEELVQKAQKQIPDLVVCDLIMPVQDGFTTLSILKADPKLKKIPVVVMTGLSQDEDRKKVMKLGAVDYLVKSSISIPDLVSVIEKYL